MDEGFYENVRGFYGMVIGFYGMAVGFFVMVRGFYENVRGFFPMDEGFYEIVRGFYGMERGFYGKKFLPFSKNSSQNPINSLPFHNKMDLHSKYSCKIPNAGARIRDSKGTFWGDVLPQFIQL